MSCCGLNTLRSKGPYDKQQKLFAKLIKSLNTLRSKGPYDSAWVRWWHLPARLNTLRSKGPYDQMSRTESLLRFAVLTPSDLKVLTMRKTLLKDRLVGVLTPSDLKVLTITVDLDNEDIFKS